MALLEITDVTMKFGSLMANRDVTFNVEEASIVGLIGPNGAGKTTLFNCAFPVTIPPHQGRFSLTGRISPVLQRMR